MNKNKWNNFTHYLIFITYCYLLTLSKTLEYSLYGFGLSSVLFMAHQVCMIIFIYSFFKIPNKIFILLTSPLFIFEILSIGHFSIFKIPLTVGGLASFLNSNMGEWIDYLKGISPITFVLCLLFTAPIFYLLLSSKQSPKFKKVYLYLIPTILVLSIKLITTRSLETTVYFTFTKSRPLQTINVIRTTYNELKKFTTLRNNLEFIDFDIENIENDENTHIVIIGESSRRHNWQIYDYDRETNPELVKSLNDIVILKDAISTSNLTLLSIQDAFYFKDKTKPINNLINILNKNGYETFWISNQQQISEIDTPISVMASLAQKSTFINTDLLSKSYDMNLLNHIRSKLLDKNKKKVIFLHTMGSHGEYVKRYPTQYSYFKDPKFHTDINNYDNTIRYTDAFINRVITIAKESDIATVTYFSDHGETVNEDGVEFPTHGNPNFKKREVEIPFFTWFNPKLKNTKKNILSANSTKKYSLINFKYDFLYLLGFSIAGAHSIYSNDYIETKREVYGSDYVIKSYSELE